MGLDWSTDRDVFTGLLFLGFFLPAIPMTWQMKAWNVGCVLFGFWCSISCLAYFINLVVWRHSMENLAPAWCEISLRIIWVKNVGIPSAGLVIARRLYTITSGTVVASTRSDKRRGLFIDLAIGLIPPLLQIPIYWVVQGHRYDILQDYGCKMAIPATWLKFWLAVCWPLFFSVISAYYCCRTLYSFFRRRMEHKSLLGANSQISFNLYLRLIFMCLAEVLSGIPFSVISIVSFVSGYKYPYTTFAELHSNFNRVDRYTRAVWIAVGIQDDFVYSASTLVGISFWYFIVFGFGQDAKRHYSSAYTTVAKKLGISTTLVGASNLSSKFSKSVSLPSFVIRRTVESKIDPLGSVDTNISRLSVPLDILTSTGPFDDLQKLGASQRSETSSAYDSSFVDEKDSQFNEPVETPTDEKPPRSESDMV